MKKFVSFIVTLVMCTTLFGMTAFAATPVGFVPVLNGTTASFAEIQIPSAEESIAISSYILQNTIPMGLLPSVKANVKIVQPKGFKSSGVTSVSVPVAGLKNGAKNVFAYVTLANGSTSVVPCIVTNGYAGFTLPGFGVATIVEVNKDPDNPNAASTSAAMLGGLSQANGLQFVGVTDVRPALFFH